MRPVRRDGFTLLETLVALSLLALLIATLAGGLRLGTRAWDSARVGASLDEADALVRALAWRLERAFPAKRLRPDGAPVVAFDGGPDSCRFVSLSEGRADWGGLIAMEIGRDGPDQLDAWTQVYREDDFVAGRDAMRITRLSDRLAKLRFSYFGAPGPGQRPQWRDEWRAAETLPRLVRLTLTLRGPRGLVTSAATVALPLQ
jgi:general secretion pathway protein J